MNAIVRPDAAYKRMLEMAADFLKAHDRFLVASHVSPDGDAVSSTLAVGWLLDGFGKQYEMVNQDPIPEKFRFLRKADAIRQPDSFGPSEPFRHAVFVDCADMDRVGRVRDLLADDAFVLNIDHHSTNDRYGAVALVDPSASATAEILYDLASVLGVSVDSTGGELIYTGLLTDTGGFRYSNTTERVLRIAADLLAVGVEGHRLAGRLLETMTFSQLELLKRGLNSLSRSADNRVAWIRITLDDMAAAGAVQADVDGLVNYALNIAGVEVGLLFRQADDGTVKVSFRSNGPVDVAEIAKKFGGGGHTRASGALIKGQMDGVVDAVVREVRRALR